MHPSQQQQQQQHAQQQQQHHHQQQQHQQQHQHSQQHSQQQHQQQQGGAVFPALHLTPLNGTFVPKQISLDPVGARVKIGRQTNAKSIPNGTNGYFDSKVLSRAHAEVWSEEGRVRFPPLSLSFSLSTCLRARVRRGAGD